MEAVFQNIKEGFIEAIAEFKDFFVMLYNSVFGFFAKFLGEETATLAMVALAFLILMLFLTKLINR